MIQREVINILGQTIYRNYSDKGYYIKNKTTGIVYTDVNSSIDYEYEKIESPDLNSWKSETCNKRIVAPISVVSTYPMLLFDLTVVRKLQLEQEGENVHIYCNYVEPEHQALIDGSQGVIYVESRDSV